MKKLQEAMGPINSISFFIIGTVSRDFRPLIFGSKDSFLGPDRKYFRFREDIRLQSSKFASMTTRLEKCFQFTDDRVANE